MAWSGITPLKIRNAGDRLDLLLEVSRTDLLEVSGDLPDEIFELIIRKRKPLVTKMKSFRKSQITKKQWRTGKWKMLKGIHKFHRSIQGKRLHRTMGRFLATKIFRPKSTTALDLMRGESLKSVSSIRTHLYIEAGYYMPLAEEVDYSTLLEYALPLLNDLEANLFEESYDAISDEVLEFLLRCVERGEVLKAAREILGKDVRASYEALRTARLALVTEDLDESSDASFFELDIFAELVEIP